MELQESISAVGVMPTHAKTAVLLSAIAYSAHVRADLDKHLPGWSLVWEGYETVDGNFGFIAVDPTGEFYGLAFRGSLPPTDIFKDWDAFANWILEDLDVISLATWHYTTYGTASISAGANRAFNNVASMKDKLRTGSSGIYNFLKTQAVSQNKKVIITGHSLGGNIANVYTSYFVTALQREGIRYDGTYLFTFAAPAAGDTTFATDLDNKVSNAWHYENVNDVIPKFPVVSTMIMASLLYVPSPSSEDIMITYDGYQMSLRDGYLLLTGLLYGFGYMQQALHYVLFNSDLDPRYRRNTLTDYFRQMGAQHAMGKYSGYLGVHVDAALLARSSWI
ncbi:lipase family protein [Chitinophaga varians]|uniref:lipase family protein n=1 Tax=Chitinophaga varians TaxID=2202339 RepID=UPI00165F886B|nr:lipase family protein [Chitinophaga varians]MBC9909668.1 lipase family protein [Chitinophaga varians]